MIKLVITSVSELDKAYEVFVGDMKRWAGSGGISVTILVTND